MPPAGLVEVHWLDAWQRPGSSGAVRCGSLRRLWPRGWVVPGHGSGRSAGRPAGRQMAVRKATGWMLGRGRAAPARRAVPPWAALAGWTGRRLVTAPGSQKDGQTGRQWVTRGPRGGCMARGGCLQGGAVHLPGRPWPSGWAAPGHSSGRSGGRLDGPTVGRQRATGRTLGRSQAAPARRAASPWVALAIINPIFTVLIL
ncbi:Uncharacterised protein [uncultured Flavonifractor sp.]|nr:Uncharacterised protein [uncultured Flavonifractor sp.]